MKKNYNAPRITVAEIEPEGLMESSYINMGGGGRPKSPRYTSSPTDESPAPASLKDCWE